MSIKHEWTDPNGVVHKEVLEDKDRQKAENWTRVMGYHRPVTDHNPGKQQEFKDRKHFKEPDAK